MPSIKNFEKKPSQKNRHSSKLEEKSPLESTSDKTTKATKRRPGREAGYSDLSAPAATDVKVVHVEKMENERSGEMMETQKNETEATQAATASEAPKEANKIEINFPGSELLRARFPKPFDVVEAVATDWMNDGSFDQLPLEQPMAKSLAQQSLLKAKEIEKKVMASPTTEKIAMQAFTYAMKAQTLFNEIKTKVNKK